MILPGAGVGVEITRLRTALGAAGDPQALIISTAMTMDVNRMRGIMTTMIG
jgi:hypothetical protein